MALNYIDQWLISDSATTGCVPISAFDLLFDISIGTASSAVGLKNCAITAEITEPLPQSNFSKIALAPHDFARTFYLIWYVNCQTIEIDLCNAVRSL